MLRYEISHPVVNDGDMVLWRALGVSSWPTLAVVSPGGRLLAMVAGEGHGRDVEDVVAAALEVRWPRAHRGTPGADEAVLRNGAAVIQKSSQQLVLPT